MKHIWPQVGRKYLPEHLREQFLEVFGQAVWREPNGQFPMSPGMALKAAIEGFGLTGVTAVTYSCIWEANDTTFELPTGLEHPDLIGTYSILGVRADGVEYLLLDLGTAIVPIAYTAEGAGCPECGMKWPLHDSHCYHSDCDVDDMAVHGCGNEETS